MKILKGLLDRGTITKSYYDKVTKGQQITQPKAEPIIPNIEIPKGKTEEEILATHKAIEEKMKASGAAR